MATVLTEEAREGYITNAPPHACPYLATSDAWCAWHIGAWLRHTGRSAPRKVSASRGRNYHVNDMLIRFVCPADIERIK